MNPLGSLGPSRGTVLAPSRRMLQNLRHAVRQLLRAPGFTALVVMTLGLGIGACSAIFSVVNGVLLRPLPVPEVDQVVAVRERAQSGSEDTAVSYGAYSDWAREATSFDSLGAFQFVSYTLTGSGEPVRPRAALITRSVLTTLGITPVLGRGFRPEEERPSSETDVAMLGHGFWQRRFGGRADALNARIELNGRPFTIVGVLPERSALPPDTEIFTPLGFSEADRRLDQARWLEVFARLRPGVTAAQARAELAAISTRAGQERPGRRGWTVELVPLLEAAVGPAARWLWSLLGAVGFLLVLACANVGHLLLVRAGARDGELAVRLALGAGGRRIVGQLLLESVLLALLGGAAGLVIAQAGLQALLSMAPDTLPRSQEVQVDGAVLAFTLVLALSTGVGFGLLPAWQAARTTPALALRRGGPRSTESRSSERLRSGLVVAQVAIALVLLTGAGLLMRSFVRLQAFDPGFRVNGALITTVLLPRAHYPSPEAPVAVSDTLLTRLAALPGVQTVAVGTNLPFAGPATRTLSVPGRVWPEGHPPVANNHLVSADYFSAMGIPLLRGRFFSQQDRRDTLRVAVVSASLARNLFPGEEAIGKVLEIGGGRARTIVGVVADVRSSQWDPTVPMRTYVPFAQGSSADFTLIVRGHADRISPALPALVRSVITSVDPRLPTYELRPLAGLVGDSVVRQRFATSLFAVFSLVALLLAAVGIYGVVNQGVLRRRQELGIRMALGADPGSVVRLVLGGAGRLMGLGLALGLAGAMLLTSLLDRLLFGVTSRDPLTFLASAALLAAVGLVACMLPARRAAGLDPMVALRTE
jgi:predicted permease